MTALVTVGEPMACRQHLDRVARRDDVRQAALHVRWAACALGCMCTACALGTCSSRSSRLECCFAVIASCSAMLACVAGKVAAQHYFERSNKNFISREVLSGCAH